MNDRRSIYAAAFLRATATGMTGVLLAIYLVAVGFDIQVIGQLLSAGLAGAGIAVGIVTFAGDRLGARRLLVTLAISSAIGLAALTIDLPTAAAFAAAFLGMVNGMGRDRGAALVIEQALLPATTTAAERTAVLGRYTALQNCGHALGAALAVAPELFSRTGIAHGTGALRGSMLVAATLTALPVLAYLRLKHTAKPSVASSPIPPLTHQSRGRLRRITALFSLDALGGGLLTATLVAYFFHVRFGVPAESIGLLFFAARVLNALSHLAAAPLARRIGLVNTMVFTHMPSSLLLVTVAIAPNFEVAALLFLLREALVEMDVPTRQSYVMAVVRPEERTYAAGVTQLVRLGGWALGAALAGWAMSGIALIVPLIAASAMKILYDILLWRSFRGLPPPEEASVPRLRKATSTT
jgi:MFS family permease